MWPQPSHCEQNGGAGGGSGSLIRSEARHSPCFLCWGKSSGSPPTRSRCQEILSKTSASRKTILFRRFGATGTAILRVEPSIPQRAISGRVRYPDRRKSTAGENGCACLCSLPEGVTLPGNNDGLNLERAKIRRHYLREPSSAPPLTGRIQPVMNRALSESRNTAASAMTSPWGQ
jgi:hypothetical protein